MTFSTRHVICNQGEIWLLHLHFSFWYLNPPSEVGQKIYAERNAIRFLSFRGFFLCCLPLSLEYKLFFGGFFTHSPWKSRNFLCISFSSICCVIYMIFHFDCQIGGNALNEMSRSVWGEKSFWFMWDDELRSNDVWWWKRIRLCITALPLDYRWAA